MGWACTVSSLTPSLLILVQNGTRRTGTGSVVTVALEAEIENAGAGAEIGATGTSAVPLGIGDDEGTRALEPLAGPPVRDWVCLTGLCVVLLDLS